MIPVIALWSHLLAACLFAGMVLWQLRQWREEGTTRPLVTAFATMTVWLIFLALLGPYHFLSHMADAARNLAFLAFMYGLIDEPEGDHRQRPVKAVYAAVSA